MDPVKRQEMIMARLGIKPVNHGLIQTILIAVPESLKDIKPERLDLLSDSLEKQGSNLVPLLVRRTEAYDFEDYEVVYGADWCLAAKELKIDRLWVWVFDMDDDQAELARSEMNLLMGSVPGPVIKTFVSDERIKLSLDALKQVVYALDKSFENIGTKLDTIPAPDNSADSFGERLTALEEKVDSVVSLVHGIESISAQLSRLEKKIDEIGNRPPVPADNSKSAQNESATTDQVPDVHLERLDKITLGELVKKFSLKEAKAMWEAIEKCRKLDGYKVAKQQLINCANNKSVYKVPNFAKGTCDKLIQFAKPPES